MPSPAYGPPSSSSTRLPGPEEFQSKFCSPPGHRPYKTAVAMSSVAPCHPDRAALLKLAATVLKVDSVEIQQLDGHLYSTYRLRGPGSTFCILRCTPLASLRLLRIEYHRLSSEAATLRLLDRRKSVAAPSLLAESASPASSYTLSGPYNGTIPADLDQPLSPTSRRSLDKSLGQHLCRLSSIPGPAFGLVSQPHSQSWARCFASLLESVLRDAEDSLLSLPYPIIRDQLRRNLPSLDQVAEPRLVFLGGASDGDIAFDASTNQITSLLDYSTAMWADPLISPAFYQPSEAFLQGYGESAGGDFHKRVRKLLYIVFHSLLAIARQCLRPSPSGSEFEARRSLTTALKLLDAVNAA